MSIDENDDNLDDPSLDAVAAQLAALRPSLSAASCDRLLYQSAFAAGKRAAATPARRWRAVSAVLATALLAAAVPLLNHSWQVSRPQQMATTGPEVVPAVPTPGQSTAMTKALSLDAWQLEQEPAAEFDLYLARFRQAGGSVRAHAMDALERDLDGIH